MKSVLSRVIAASLALSLTLGASAPLAHAKEKPDPRWNQLRGQLATDLTQAGITFAAGLTGSIPLALIAGILGKYISTYGIQGIRNLIDSIKGYPPQDLGEVNLAYTYLIHVKRNLYSTLISIRKAAEAQNEDSLGKELDDLEKDVTNLCATGNCIPTTLDESLVNYSFLQIALDAKASLDVNKYLSVNETKNTYHYLLLLYLDVLMTEQQLIQTQTLVIGTQIQDTIAGLKKNPYISEAEKEYQAQLAMNIGLRWQKMLDERRVMLGKVLAKPLADLERENREIQDELDRERAKNPPKHGRFDEDEEENGEEGTEE